MSTTKLAQAIEVRGISKTFKPRSNQPVHALKDVSLSVRPGEIVALLGTNGAGKTLSLIHISEPTRPAA